VNLNHSPTQPERTNKMRFMVIVKATEDEGALPDPQFMADMNKFNDGPLGSWGPDRL